ncbi:hypothetical protein [Amycolatopsis sp. NPDC051128]|uniref:hypothetical protein n=1 Tax=Amycolatopsis sp. NPDC051128 TaxID=3155412 RepID=UPI00344569DD
MTAATTQRQERATARATRPKNGRNGFKQAEHHDLVIERMATFGNSRREIPRRIVLLHDPRHSGNDQLYLDQLPIPRDAWSYDAHDRTLTWRGAFGGGHFRFSHDGRGGHGNIGPAHDLCSVTAGARAQFICDVALNCGASYETSGGSVVGLIWDPSCAAWNSASWVAERLQLTYTVTPEGPIAPPTFTFDFQDNVTQAIPWDPTLGSFEAALQLGQQNGTLVWQLSFKSYIPPQDDTGPNPATGPDTVYPYWLQAVEDSAAATINGVLEIDNVAPNGTLVGMRGVRANPAATGYYRTSAQAAAFAVFDGKLIIGGKPVAGAGLIGDRLRWSDLDLAYQQLTGLPASGSMRFNRDGSSAAIDDAAVRITRLSTTAALSAISRHSDLHPEMHQRSLELTEALGDSSLDIFGLLAMTPFGQNQQGAWGDMVQAAVTQDLSDIMNSFIPSAMWGLLFPGTTQPTLTGELATVANSPVQGVPNPSEWYGSLATAVMTQGMSTGSDPNCAYLNGPRAAAWLKTQVATSKVYYTHGQELFEYEWQQHCPMTAQYLADQVTNAAQYQNVITQTVALAIADINDNVVVDPTSPPDLKANLIADVQNAGQYATTNNVYWAFAFYTYNVAPSILANIAMQMSINTGSGDGTTLSRLFQQNVAVLTALDPSGFFAQRYTSTINTFLCTNILPSMFGFLGDATSFDIIKEYLQTFVQNNINNEDQQIAEAAAQIATILQDQNADQLLHDSIEALRTISAAIQDSLALPYVASKWVSWFSKEYPKFSAVGNLFGSLLIGGITTLAVFNLFTEFKSWDQLSTAERANLVLDTVQLGLQIVSAVVKRGVRIYAIFNVDGMTAAQRAAAVSKIIASGEADQLDQGLVRIGNSTARWLGDTQGTVGKFAVGDEGGLTAVLVTDTTAAAEDASWAARILGKNLDEFIATRIGPLFILAGIGFSIYTIIEGESGVALASDILNIVGGSLMLFATLGSWLVEGGVIAAEGVMASIFAFAGPLSILVALAGLGLMLYEIFKKPADPVEQFVTEYAKPAGFTVSGKASSLDYATPFINPDESNLLMVGFSLSVDEIGTLLVNPDGSIQYGEMTHLPNCVWQASTDGLGMSTIFTVAQPDDTKPPVALYLSMMSDNTVSFQPPMPPPQSSPASSPTTPTVITQTWLSVPEGNATLTSDGKHMVALTLAFRPIPPDKNGNYSPAQASGSLVATESGVIVSDQAGTAFTLVMMGMAPNFMTMVDLSFILDSTPSTLQTFGPTFGVVPSTQATYACEGDPLPAFLGFSTQTGAFTPNGQMASPASSTNNTISATNSCGTASAPFTTTVAAPPPPPTATA